VEYKKDFRKKREKADDGITKRDEETGKGKEKKGTRFCKKISNDKLRKFICLQKIVSVICGF